MIKNENCYVMSIVKQARNKFLKSSIDMLVECVPDLIIRDELIEYMDELDRINNENDNITHDKIVDDVMDIADDYEGEPYARVITIREDGVDTRYDVLADIYESKQYAFFNYMLDNRKLLGSLSVTEYYSDDNSLEYFSKRMYANNRLMIILQALKELNGVYLIGRTRHIVSNAVNRISKKIYEDRDYLNSYMKIHDIINTKNVTHDKTINSTYAYKDKPEESKKVTLQIINY